MYTKEKIIEILQELSGLEEITEEAFLIEDIGLDSLLMVSMLIEFEEAFDIEFKESDMNPFDLITVKDAITLVESYIGG